jgi:putative transcriptional regulator
VPPEPGAKSSRVGDWLVTYGIGVPVVGLLMGGIYSLPAIRVCKGRDPWLTLALAAALAMTVFGLGTLVALAPAYLSGLWAASLLLLLLQRRLHGSLDGNLERFGLVHAFALFALAVGLLFTGPAAAQQDRTPNSVLLVARPELADPNFARTVVLATRAGEGHTVGVILNRPTAARIGGRPIGFGGPVLPASRIALFVADTAPEAAAFPVLEHVYLTMHPKNVDALLAQPRARVRLFAGFAAWAPGQLERELDEASWYVLPADESLLFRETADGLWEELVARAAGART